MNTTTAPMSRKGSLKKTSATDAARDQHAMTLAQDPRWMLLKAIDRRYMKTLLAWHDPLTGYLQYRTRALNLTTVLDVSEETLRTSRKRLIEAGLIVSYAPGSGHIASTYCIARSWEEAEEAAALRRQPDAPHFPNLVDRTPSAVNGRTVPQPEDTQDPEPEETPEERTEAQERYARARRRRGVKGPVPPELGPELKPWEITALRERAEREADPQRLDLIRNGAKAVRAEIRHAPSTSGAA